MTEDGKCESGRSWWMHKNITETETEGGNLEKDWTIRFYRLILINEIFFVMIDSFKTLISAQKKKKKKTHCWYKTLLIN
ncbi:hypothetical protein EUGRSUZ_K02479 [Eucalyptus grandis]|uniref:Uncharacterized protein n=2 Tax=Eucalyptus grandis TaxID=71139 RepID=A0ACC3IWI4_EUCGR|nr:hypothetical protein EUGRSUZ_K02479 [Eucalyptus grandis]